MEVVPLLLDHLRHFGRFGHLTNLQDPAFLVVDRLHEIEQALPAAEQHQVQARDQEEDEGKVGEHAVKLLKLRHLAVEVLIVWDVRNLEHGWLWHMLDLTCSILATIRAVYCGDVHCAVHLRAAQLVVHEHASH